LRQAGSTRNSGEDKEPAHVVAARILTDYLSDKLHQPVAGWTLTRVGELLQAKGVSAELIERAQTCLMLGEMGRYAPATHPWTGGDLLSETRQLVDALERAL
jgi:hypothetical protein